MKVHLHHQMDLMVVSTPILLAAVISAFDSERNNGRGQIHSLPEISVTDIEIRREYKRKGALFLCAERGTGCISHLDGSLARHSFFDRCYCYFY
jgi:adenylylsulfate kinase-like enzyme